MAEILADKSLKQSFRPSFFLCITLLMAFFIFAGFGLTYWQPMAQGILGPLPPVVHIHGLFYFSWILLLVVQAFLINTKNIKLHRSLGTFGIGLAASLVVLGSLITILFLGGMGGATTPEDYGLTYLSIVAVLFFGTLFFLAIRNVRNPDKHKRLILFATIVLLPPGINRLYMMLFELRVTPFLPTYLTMDLLIAAIALYDWRTLGKVSNTTLFGAAMVIIPQLLFSPIIASEAFASLCTILTNMAYYR